MIERVYLQWVGTRYYATIDSFVTETERRGVSKKLPNRNVAVEVAKPGTVIFLVHDQGRTRECLACVEPVVCPTCFSGNPECPRCRGLGAIEIGTGGFAVVDGERWNYTRYIRLRRNTGHEFWDEPHEIGAVESCQTCGGRGRLPEGAVFALYSPDAVLYVSTRGSRSAADRELMRGGIRVVPLSAVAKIAKRGSGRYQPESFYALTKPTVKTDPKLVSWTAKRIGDGAVVYRGNFGRLVSPIPYPKKQFRGLKRWEPPVVEAREEPVRSILEGVA